MLLVKRDEQVQQLSDRIRISSGRNFVVVLRFRDLSLDGLCYSVCLPGSVEVQGVGHFHYVELDRSLLSARPLLRASDIPEPTLAFTTHRISKASFSFDGDHNILLVELCRRPIHLLHSRRSRKTSTNCQVFHFLETNTSPCVQHHLRRAQWCLCQSTTILDTYGLCGVVWDCFHIHDLLRGSSGPSGCSSLCHIQSKNAVPHPIVVDDIGLLRRVLLFVE
mmetsp:Transcript_36515/g.54460  ORF Transcript_36515/g.54460 Transcript_36515/m.54460 type:complete len:221 (+) Transcript_36515:345-1007(+)